MNCSTKNIIYLIICCKCYIQYVGETGQRLKDRLNNHRSYIITKKVTPIAIHFNHPQHTSENLKIIPIKNYYKMINISD